MPGAPDTKKLIAVIAPAASVVNDTTVRVVPAVLPTFPAV